MIVLDWCILCDGAEWVLAIATGLVATGLVWGIGRLEWYLKMKDYEGEFVRVESQQYGGGPSHGLELHTVMRLVRIRYAGHRMLSVTAKYWHDMPLAEGRVEFPLSRYVGTGNYWYHDNAHFGRYTMELFPDSDPDRVHLYYDGTMPAEVRGFEVLKRRSRLTSMDLPEHLRSRFDEFLPQIESSFTDAAIEPRPVVPA